MKNITKLITNKYILILGSVSLLVFTLLIGTVIVPVAQNLYTQLALSPGKGSMTLESQNFRCGSSKLRIQNDIVATLPYPSQQSNIYFNEVSMNHFGMIESTEDEFFANNYEITEEQTVNENPGRIRVSEGRGMGQREFDEFVECYTAHQSEIHELIARHNHKTVDCFEVDKNTPYYDCTFQENIDLGGVVFARWIDEQ